MQLERDAARGVHRVEDAAVNWYLVEDGGRYTAVDAGLPASWRSLGRALRALGSRPSALAAVVLTHAHFDHVGFAARARRELGARVLAHRDERALAGHPLRYRHERSPLRYAWRPGTAAVLARMAAAGAPVVRPVRDLEPFDDGDVLDVPGSPRVVATPGHTFGHSSLELADRDALIAGDAIVTLDPYTAEHGPRIVAGAATADSTLALASLDRLEALPERTLLPGHGVVWTQGVAEAARRARVAGAR